MDKADAASSFRMGAELRAAGKTKHIGVSNFPAELLREAVETTGWPTLAASRGKVFWSELDIALHETAMDLLGPHAELRGRPGPDGRWLEDYLFSLAGPIYAGTNEIQRNVIAERLLGLPR